MLFQHNGDHMIFLLTFQGCGQKKESGLLASPLEVCDTCSTCLRAPFDVVSTALSKGVPCCPVRDQTTRLDSKPFTLA